TGAGSRSRPSVSRTATSAASARSWWTTTSSPRSCGRWRKRSPTSNDRATRAGVPMGRFPWFGTIGLLLGLGPTVEAAERPSFSAPHSAWHATHVVVVDQEGKILESWKGDLQAEQTVPLKAFLQEAKIPQTPKIVYHLVEKPKGAPDHVSGKRLVVFL